MCGRQDVVTGAPSTGSPQTTLGKCRLQFAILTETRLQLETGTNASPLIPVDGGKHERRRHTCANEFKRRFAPPDFNIIPVLFYLFLSFYFLLIKKITANKTDFFISVFIYFFPLLHTSRY